MIAVDVSDYTYELPDDRIARHPLARRDESKLLVYRKGEIAHKTFGEIADVLPPDSFLYFNNTRVIPARLIFHKETGAEIEIFLLTPVAPHAAVDQAMACTHSCVWECSVGNIRRWKDNQVLRVAVSGTLILEAELIDRNKNHVLFRWNSNASFAEVIGAAGETPLPPYLKRRAGKSDALRYQTVYARADGAVAAPTAGLHFTERMLADLATSGVGIDYLTLHVSAGTFQPIKVARAADHIMHEEQIVISRKTLDNLLKEDKFVVAVGTTSMRTLESLYWYGVKLLNDRNAVFHIDQRDPYRSYALMPSAGDSIRVVADYLDAHHQDHLAGKTSLFITPGYTFRIGKGLVTNFHQPGSTLILLIGAFAGKDWRKIYDEALANGYRFLSYGDSSIILP